MKVLISTFSITHCYYPFHELNLGLSRDLRRRFRIDKQCHMIELSSLLPYEIHTLSVSVTPLYSHTEGVNPWLLSQYDSDNKNVLFWSGKISCWHFALNWKVNYLINPINNTFFEITVCEKSVQSSANKTNDNQSLYGWNQCCRFLRAKAQESTFVVPLY